MERRSLPSGGLAIAVHNGSGTITAKDDFDVTTQTQFGPLRTTIHLSLIQTYKANGQVVQTASYSRHADYARGYATINGRQVYGLYTEISQGSINKQESRFPLRFALDAQGNVRVNFAQANINEKVTRVFLVNGKSYKISEGTQSQWFGALVRFGSYPSGVLPKQIKGRVDKIDPGTGEHNVTTWDFHT